MTPRWIDLPKVWYPDESFSAVNETLRSQMANIFLKSLPSELIFLGYHTPVNQSIKLEYDTPVSQSSQGMSPYRKSLMTPGSTAIS